MNTNNAQQGVTQPALTSNEVVAQIKQGCVSCFSLQNNDPNQPLYPFNPSTGTPWQSS